MKKSILLMFATLSIILLAGCAAKSEPDVSSAASEQESSTEAKSTAAPAKEFNILSKMPLEVLAKNINLPQPTGITELIPALANRTTTRDAFDPNKQLSYAELTAILEAGTSTPSAINQRAVDLFVINGRGILNKLGEAGLSKAFFNAPTVILIAENVAETFNAARIQLDSGSTAMAMVSQATDMGLATAVLAVSDKASAALSSNLNLDEGFKPVLTVAFGSLSDDNPDAVTSASTINYNPERIHFNRISDEKITAVDALPMPSDPPYIFPESVNIKTTLANNPLQASANTSVIPALKNRLTTRDAYDTKASLTDAEYKLLMEAAFSAPTAVNQQSLEYLIINDREFLAELYEAKAINKAALTATAMIILLDNTKETGWPGYVQFDTGLTAMAIMEQATAMGLGTVPLSVGSKTVDTLKTKLNLGSSYEPLVTIALGALSTENPDATTAASATQGIENRVHYNATSSVEFK